MRLPDGWALARERLPSAAGELDDEAEMNPEEFVQQFQVLTVRLHFCFRRGLVLRLAAERRRRRGHLSRARRMS